MNEKNKAWLCLLCAGLSEVIWAYTMKLSCGFTVLVPSIITVAVLAGGFFLLAKAVNVLGIGTSYAVFTGIGTVLNVGFGILVFGESKSVKKLLCVAAVVIGIVGLRLS